MMIVVTNHEDVSDADMDNEKIFQVSFMVDDHQYMVWVYPASGEYEYGQSLPDELAENDEPIQIAIGKYFDANGVDIGTVRR